MADYKNGIDSVFPTKFGDRSELLEEGKRRVVELSKTNPQACLYGEHELGGLHILYVLADSPEVYGLPEEPKFPITATVQEKALCPFTGMAWAAVTTGLTLNVLVARARQLRKKED